jgi:hypothetical protein
MFLEGKVRWHAGGGEGRGEGGQLVTTLAVVWPWPADPPPAGGARPPPPPPPPPPPVRATRFHRSCLQHHMQLRPPAATRCHANCSPLQILDKQQA